MNGRAARRLKFGLGLGATAGFAWLLAHELDPGALARAFARLPAGAVALAAVFMAAAHAARIVRWWWMLRALEPGLPLGACVRPFLASMAFNNVLPLRAGDALRVLGFRGALRSPAMRILGTLAIERALDVACLCGIFFLGVSGLPEGAFPPGVAAAVGWLAGACAAAGLAAALLSPLFARLRIRAPGRRFLAKAGWAESVSRWGRQLAEALGVMRSAPRTLALVALSALVWICEGAAFVVIAEALRAGVAPLGPWLSLAAGALATAIPSTPGHVGTFDYFAARGLAAYGAGPEIAAALALTIHALWAPFTAAGLVCYWVPRPGGGRSSEKGKAAGRSTR